MTKINTLTNMLLNTEYSADVVIDKIDREGNKETRAPLSVICKMEETGFVFKAITWEYDLILIFKEACEKRKVCEIKIFANVYHEKTSIKISEIHMTDRDSAQKPIVTEDRTDPCKKYLLDIVETITNENYKKIINYILKDNRFFEWPAAKSVHHSFKGGLAVHTANVVNCAISLAQQYQGLNGMPINLDLVMAGAILHDCGKMDEYLQNGEFSSIGRLLSHIIIGIEKIDEACTVLNIDKTSMEMLNLKHVVAAHHGKLEFGSPNLPAIPEALIVSQADNADAKLEVVSEELAVMNTGDQTRPISSLEGMRIYKQY